MPKYNKKCVICNKKYSTPSKKQIYCNYLCSKKAQRWKKQGISSVKDYIKICLMCKKRFTAIRINSRYCSLKCTKSHFKQKYPDKIKKYHKRYRKKHKKLIAIRQRKYIQSLSPERRRQLNNINRKAKKQRRLNVRFKIFQRNNFTCQYCGRKTPEVILEIDHKYPQSKSYKGKWKRKNLVTACRDCNRGKGDIILDEFKS